MKPTLDSEHLDIVVMKQSPHAKDDDKLIILQTLFDVFHGKSPLELIEFIISKEPDGNWRVTQERILPEDEFDNDKRRGAL